MCSCKEGLNVSIIIPNYNGKELLEKNLPFLFEAIKNYKENIEIIVVDDGSFDRSIYFLNENYPSIKVISLKKNLGFSKAVNIGVKEAKYKIIYLLNNDIRVEKDFLSSIVEHFKDPFVFSVSSCQIQKENQNYNTVYPKIFLGMFLHYYSEVFDKDSIEILFSSAGASAFDKDKFLSLGGFDELYSPFYFEDIDLCWRAYRKGYKCLLEPKSIVIHKGRETISKLYKDSKINSIYWRNYFFFLFKNFPFSLILKFFLFFPINFFIAEHIRSNFLKGLLEAIKKIKYIYKIRKKLKKEKFLYNYKDIINYFKNIPQKKSVLYISDTGNIIGGGELSLYDLIKNFKNLDFRVYLLTKEEGDFTKKVSNLNIPVFIFPIKKLKNPLNIFSALKFFIYLSKIIDRYRINIIHSNSTSSLTFLASFLCFIRRIPLIWHIRSINSFFIFDLIVGIFSKKIIVISNATKRRFFLMPFIKNKIVLIYNGIDLEKFKIENGSFRENLGLKDEFLVGTVGRFINWKGYEYFLKSAKLVLEKIKDVKFLIVGIETNENSYLRYLKKLAKKLNIQKNIIFLNRVEDINLVFNSLDVFVFTSLKESFGRVLVEAMASYKSVVAFNKFGPSEIIENNISGFLVKPKDYKELASKIIYLLENKDIRERLGKNARKIVEDKFSLDRCIEDIKKIYLEVLN